MGIFKDPALLTESLELRRCAEEQSKIASPEAAIPRKDMETQRLVYELEVHQIELEMQNSELRHARLELETALEKYTDLYDCAPVGYITLDLEGRMSVVNLAGASLIGSVRSALIGRHFTHFIAMAQRHDFKLFIEKVRMSTSKESCEVELQKGDHQPVIVRIEATTTATGQEFRLVLIDISEQRRASDALALKQRELEDLNNSLDQRIEQAVEELRSKDQLLIMQGRRAAMGEMIGNIAHQWRQPLNVLGLYLQELPIMYDKPEFDREFLVSSIRRSMDVIMHMSRTIDDFRYFFLNDKEKVSVSTTQVIGKTLTLIEDSFLSQRIHIVCNLGEGSTFIGYPNEYSQVLLNILLNARDALVTKNIVEGTIFVNAFDDGGKSVVTVSDNAGGIAADIIDKVFDPYFTTKGPDKGTGIGLFMSKTIIENNMGGSLTVSNVGSGAEFRIEM